MMSNVLTEGSTVQSKFNKRDEGHRPKFPPPCPKPLESKSDRLLRIWSSGIITEEDKKIFSGICFKYDEQNNKKSLYIDELDEKTISKLYVKKFRLTNFGIHNI